MIQTEEKQMTLRDRMLRASPIWRRIIKRAEDAATNKGIMGSAVINGGAAGNHTVAAIKLNDHLFGVHEITSGGGAADLTSEFSITADGVINNTGGTATTGDQLLVLWEAFDDE